MITSSNLGGKVSGGITLYPRKSQYYIVTARLITHVIVGQQTSISQIYRHYQNCVVDQHATMLVLVYTSNVQNVAKSTYTYKLCGFLDENIIIVSNFIY